MNTLYVICREEGHEILGIFSDEDEAYRVMVLMVNNEIDPEDSEALATEIEEAKTQWYYYGYCIEQCNTYHIRLDKISNI